MIELLAFYVVLLFIAVVSEPIAERLDVPFSAFLVVLGFAASEVLIAFGGDTGLRWDAFRELIFFVFLPVLIFEAAFNTDVRELLKNLPLILFLALPLMLLATGITAVILFYGIGHPDGFPWLAALIAAALLSATDPVAVLALFKRFGAPGRLRTIIDGESLFNDATAIVLFSVLLALATGERATADLSQGTLDFLRIFFGGGLAGALVGGTAFLALRVIDGAVARGVISLIAAYGAFLLAESQHVSGVMAAMSAGLLLGHSLRKSADVQGLRELWEYKAWLANALLFLIAGISFQLAMFTEQWLAMLIGILGVLVARALNVYALVPLLGRLPGITPLPRDWRPVVWWGGVRGAVTLALALSLPLSLDYWWTIQSIAYGVVLWTLVVQASSMPWVMSRSGVLKA